MISFKNPFKKEEDSGFQLDEYSLPSLNDSSNPSQGIGNNNSDLPTLPENNSFNTGQTPSLNDETNPYNTGLNNSLPSSFESQTPQFNNSNLDNSSSNSLHNDISKAKMETIEAKLSLMDARQSAMEQKINMIYEMILNEVSPETKKKLKLKSMMDSLRDAENN